MKKIFQIFIFTILYSCSNDDSIPVVTNIDYDALNETEISTYITDNNLTTETTDSGLYFIINEESEGESPTSTSNVTLAYTGYFLNGDVFDQSDNATFNLTGLISGFSEGTQLLKEGGSGTFILPSRLAYGTQGSGSIPPGAVIVFDIDLIAIN